MTHFNFTKSGLQTVGSAANNRLSAALAHMARGLDAYQHVNHQIELGFMGSRRDANSHLGLVGRELFIYPVRPRTPPPELSAGSWNWNVAPCGRLGLAQNCPPWASMIVLQIESPMPMPLDFVVKNGAKI